MFQRLFKASVGERGCSIWAQWEKLAPELSQWWICWEAGEPHPPQPSCQVSMRTQECLQLCWCSLEVRTAFTCVCCWELLKRSYSLEGWMYSSPQENLPNQMPVTDKLCRQCARDTLKPASCMDINISINRPVGKSGDWSTFAGAPLQIAVSTTPRMGEADSAACFVWSFINQVKCAKMYFMSLFSREKNPCFLQRSVFFPPCCFYNSYDAD